MKENDSEEAVELEPLLEIKDLSAFIGEKEILANINLTIQPGSFHVILGPNGSGKSSLLNVIMGSKDFSDVKGSIFFEGEEITYLSTDERAKKGIFLAFQEPVSVPGVPIYQFLRQSMSAYRNMEVSALEARMEILDAISVLGLDKTFAQRNLNENFSGGERKKNEILQMTILKPKLALLDETDTGLDIDALRILQKSIDIIRNERGNCGFLYITHYQKIIDVLNPDFVHILIDGTIVESGSKELARVISKTGFEKYISK